MAAVVVLETMAIKEGETSMAAGGSREGAEGDSMEGVVVTGAEGEVVSKSLAVDRAALLCPWRERGQSCWRVGRWQLMLVVVCGCGLQ
jgi:hypothetical protein